MMRREATARTEQMIGREGCERLAGAHVLIVGLGGVGSYAAEALARSGVGTLTLIDYDHVSESNLNRQLVALRSTIGQLKVDVMRARILDINPDAVVDVLAVKFSRTVVDTLNWSSFDYVIDAIDALSAKVELVVQARAAGVPIISAMGAANKFDPTQFTVTELFNTINCPLARFMRKRLRKRGVDSLEVVFSPEQAFPADATDLPAPVLGSLPFVPSVVGLILAGVVFRRLAGA